MDMSPGTDRRPPSSRTDYAVFREIATRWSDNDPYGHLNNAVHHQLFDTAVNGWLIEERWLDIHHSERIGLVVEMGCRYFAEAAFPDRVTAGIRIGRLGTSSVRYEVGLFRNEDSLAFAEGFFVHVQVNRATRRPEPLPEPFRARLQEIAR